MHCSTCSARLKPVTSMPESTVPTTNYVRESYAREKHPDSAELIELRRGGFDRWYESEKRKWQAEALRGFAVPLRAAVDEWEASGDDERLVNDFIDPWLVAILDSGDYTV